MGEKTKKTKTIYIRFFLIRLAMVVFDILAVNCAYICALFVRYYVASEFNDQAVQYIDALVRFAPFYTVCCLITFWLFKLYNNRWKYAGINDINRILAASFVTCIIYIVGSVLIVMRMPLSYYVLGAAIQFALIAASRFSYRLLNIEMVHVRNYRNSDAVNVVIVGVGESSRIVMKHLERNEENAVRPVCMVDLREDEFGGTVGGVPIVCGIDKIVPSVKKYSAECVILADSSMPNNIKKEIKNICKTNGIEVQDFSGYFKDSRGAISLRKLLKHSKGEVELIMDGKSQHFVSGEQAFMSLDGKYIIKSIYAKNDCLVIELLKDILVPNDVHEEWVKTYEKETGENISFF